MADYVDRLMRIVLRELTSSRQPTEEINAAFCVGELCKNGGESALKYPLSPYSSSEPNLTTMMCIYVFRSL
ncbi:ARM repeat superfamily protein [Euphorbia peplus]|nr:ARM repeat superfamily protein [Euphorbia peplus]